MLVAELLLLFAAATLGRTIGVAATTLICVVASLGEETATDDLGLLAEDADKSAIGDEISLRGFSL